MQFLAIICCASEQRTNISWHLRAGPTDQQVNAIYWIGEMDMLKIEILVQRH